MKTFNLSKQILTVEAVGYQHMFGRDPYEWWDYDMLMSQGDPVWDEYVEDDPSLQRVLREAGDRRQKYCQSIKNVYGVDSTQASNIIKTYIGYGPAESYIVNIGPYFSKGYIWGESHQRISAIDKFGYFVLRKGKFTAKETNKALAKQIRKYVDSYGIEFEPSDFKLVVRTPSDFDPSRGKQETRQIIEEVTSLGGRSLLPNPGNNPEIDAQNAAIERENRERNPEATDFYSRGPAVGEGSTIEPNQKGYEKLMRAMMGPWYEETILEKAATKMTDLGMSQEQARQAVTQEYLSDFGEMEDLYKTVYRKYEEAVQRGDPSAIGMNPPPKFRSAPLMGHPGAQQFTHCPDIKIVRSLLMVRRQIAELLREGIEDPTEILQRINAGRTPKKQFKIENVIDEINKINSIKQSLEDEGDPDASNIINYIDNQVGEINEKIEGEKAKDAGKDTVYGFSDLRTAFEMASLYLPGFDPPPNFDNYTSEDLVRFVNQKGDSQEEGLPESVEEATQEDIEESIGVAPKAEKVLSPRHKKTQVVQPLVEEENTEELLDLLSVTIRNLIKVSKELDDEGKEDAAEEIHKVIRKYQVEIV